MDLLFGSCQGSGYVCKLGVLLLSVLIIRALQSPKVDLLFGSFKASGKLMSYQTSSAGKYSPSAGVSLLAIASKSP